jgi:hypothetical protein
MKTYGSNCLSPRSEEDLLNKNVREERYSLNMNIDIKPLSVTHPSLAGEAFGWDPSKVLAESHEKIAWKCKKNHIWVEKIINRTENDINCPKCEKI